MSNRSLAYDFKPEKKETKKQVAFSLLSKNVSKTHKKTSSLSLIITMTMIFAMLFVINCRYNTISEKNLELQRLQIKQTEVSGLAMNAELEYSKLVDINEIEAYAKQQLGMQEPVKSQIIYIEAENSTKINKNESGNFVSNVVNTINNFVKNVL